jgi:hypothetical protein
MLVAELYAKSEVYVLRVHHEVAYVLVGANGPKCFALWCCDAEVGVDV